MMNLWQKDHQSHRLYYGKYLCRQWNDNRPKKDEKVDTFEILYMEEITQFDRIAAPSKKLLWSHRCFKPGEIYIPHPEIDTHPTHKIVSELVLDELAEMSGSKEFKPENIWCYEVWTPFSSYDRIEDISQYIDIKVMAIEAHRSQLEYKNYTEGILGLNRYRAVFDERHGVSEMEYAEVFIELKL